MHAIRSSLLPVLFLGVCLGPGIQAQEKPKIRASFRDSTDGAFDMSNWLLHHKGFLLVPTVITEPAIGYGVAGAVVFFHSSYSEKKGPPSMSGALGGWTESDTWMGGAFHYGFWKGDRIRYQGLLLRANMNVAYYGSGNIAILGDKSLNMNLDAWFLTQQMTFRLGKSNFFAGARYLFLPTDITLSLPTDTSGIPIDTAGTGQTFASTLSEASGVLVFDSRSNIFTPKKGVYLELSGTYSDTWFGGDSLYGRINGMAMGYFPASSNVTVGIRWEGHFSVGSTLFWARPWVKLRGAPQMKYQNQNTVLMETEVDWNLYKRWTLVGFTGIGNAFAEIGDFDRGKTVRTLGAGFRYLIARELGADMGMDFAFSNDDFAFYVVFGTAWTR